MDVKRGISGYLVASLLLHLIIGIILLVGVDFSKPKRPESKGQIVNAVMMDSEMLEQQMQQVQQQKQAQQGEEPHFLFSPGSKMTI